MNTARVNTPGEKQARFPPALGVALGLLFIVPFLVYYRPPPIGDFHTEWLAAVLLAVVVCAALPTLKRPYPALAGLLAMPVTLAGVIGVHLFLGRYIYFYDWGLWLAYLGIFCTALALGQGLRTSGLSEEVTSRMAWAIVLTALMQLFTQLAQVYHLEQAFSPFIVGLMDRSVCRIHGNIGQANQATTMAWLGVAAAAYLFHERRMHGALAALAIAALLISSALTASRMAWLFALIVAAAWVWFDPKHSRKLTRRLTLAAMLLGGFAAADFVAVHLIRLVNDTCASGLERVAEESGTYSIRWELWRQAIMVWHQFPWFGSGAGGFMGWVYKLEVPGVNEPLDGYAHNSLLQLLAEFGIVGAAAATGFLLWSAVHLYKARREIDSHRLLPLIWVAILLTYSMLEFPLWYMHFLIFFGICIGLLMNPAWGRATISVRPRPVLGLAAAAILLGASYVAYEYKKAEHAYNLIADAMALHALSSEELNKTLDQISDGAHLYRLHLEFALNARVPITRDDLQKKLADNTRLMNRIPTVAPMVQQILLLTLAGDSNGAQATLRRMLQFSPPGVDLGLADLRRFVKERPTDFAALGPLIDEEVKRAPKPRW